jgi:hypothetical protein
MYIFFNHEINYLYNYYIYKCTYVYEDSHLKIIKIIYIYIWMCYFYITLPYINFTPRYIGCETHVYETYIYGTHMYVSHTLCAFVGLM